MLLATVADVFRYGASVWLLVAAFTLMGFLAIFVYLPVFFKLQVNNIYDYLEKRFDRKTRILAVLFYILSEILMFPVFAYTPSLTIATGKKLVKTFCCNNGSMVSASGVNVSLVAFILCVICIFYTSVGGFRTVVWTDFLQFGVIMAALVCIYVTGLGSSGGFISVWNTALSGDRLQIFNFRVDPTARDSFWGYLLGSGAVSTAVVIVHQTGAQKFLTLSKYTDCRWSVVHTVVSMSLVHTCCIFIGLLVYAKYKDCDPLTGHLVLKHDQIFPYFVTEVGSNFPGLVGLFIAAICSASLRYFLVCNRYNSKICYSSMSSNLNALAGVLYKDIACFVLKKQSTDFNNSGSGILKVIVLVVGALCTCLVFVVERLGEVLSISLMVTGLTQGPVLGVFTLGILFPKANSKV